MGWKVNATTLPAVHPENRPGSHSTGDWVGPHFQSGQVRKFWPPMGLDPQTVQPVASRYTDLAIPAHISPSAWVNNE